MAEYRELADPHPHWSDFPGSLPEGTQIIRMNRERLLIKPQDGLTIDELDDVQSDTGPITLRRYQKAESSGRLPLLLFMHPGGFVNGGLETEDALCRTLALQLSVMVLSIEYRLAPKYPFPAGFEDCLNVIRWVTAAAVQDRIGVDLSRGFIVGGHSAGGNFTAGLAHAMLEEELQPQPTGLLFMASSFCHPDVRPPRYRGDILSVDEIDDAPGLTSKEIRYFAEQYGAPPDDKRYSPLLYESRKGLAKRAFFQICGWDPRRDEAILYCELLNADGVEAKSKIYKGLPHGFWLTCPTLPESQQAVQDTVEGVRWLLG